MSLIENIVMQIDEDDSFEQGVLYNDQPLILYVSFAVNDVNDLDEIKNLELGSSDNPWYKQIVFYIDDHPAPNEMSLLSHSPKKSVFEIKSDYSFLAEFGLDPALVKNIRQGSHAITAQIKFSSNLDSEITSNKITITKKDEPLPDSLKKEQHMLRIAEFFTDRGNLQKSENILLKLLDANPKSIDALTDMGMLEEARQNKEKALEYYQSALEEFYRQFPDDEEGPEVLASKILDLGGELPVSDTE